MAGLGSSVDIDDVRRFVRAIFRAAPHDAFVEVRFRRATGMGQSFHRVDALGAISTEVVAHARQRDVFVGVIPRRRRSGGREDLVREAAVVWADCDGPSAVAALRRFEPKPSMVIATGSESNCHAYWFLARPVASDALQRTNRRLALALGADARSCDAARILRPAGTANWKTRPPGMVRLVKLDLTAQADLRDLERGLPELAARTSQRGVLPARVPRLDTTDQLLDIAPRTYVEQLSGQVVGSDHKVRCPFHDDRSPSLHVFDEPARGWFCFGCARGGSIYDFAGLLWNRGLRGAEFLRLRRELRAAFLGEVRRPDRDAVERREVGSRSGYRSGPRHGLR